MLRAVCMVMLSLTLMACAGTSHLTTPRPTTGDVSELQQGKRYFNEGYYKRAMHKLLPLACDGSREAQYAVGYMYYYGYGVAQDSDVGHFWIQRSADAQYLPAIKALEIISHDENKKVHAGEKYRKYR